MKPEAVITIRPLSPRFASLEQSLQERKGHSSEPSKYDGESRLSPRILERADESTQDNNCNLPEIRIHRISPVQFLDEESSSLYGSSNSSLGSSPTVSHYKMSLSFDKTPDSDSISIATRPLLEELQEAGFSGNVANGYFGAENDLVDSSELSRGRKKEKDEASVKSKSAENKHKQLRQTSPSRIPRLKGAGGIANKNTNDLTHKSESETSLVNSDLGSLKTTQKDDEHKTSDKDGKGDVTVTDNTSLKDPQQQTAGSNMERKLLSNLPKKLREEAVLRTFASNLKLASATSKTGFNKKQVLEGRQSVDSGRESVVEEEGKPRLYRFDSNSSVSSVGSTRSAIRAGNGSIKPWTVAMAAETIKKRREGAATKGKRANKELDTLKEKFEQAQAKCNSLEAELDPLREKLRRYEGIIESLEDKVEESKHEMLIKERDHLAKVDRLERAHSKLLQEERASREDTESDLKNRIRQCESEVKFYKKQVDELEDSLAMLKEGSEVDEDNSPAAKQMASLRKELVQVREVLSTSEKERLSERKEKLSALQNMIKLTKVKSDIEEELDERKKADTKENSDKYMQLSGKLAVSEMKLQKLRKDMSTEIEQLQKKHMDETRTLNTNHEKIQTQLRKEMEVLRSQLRDLEDQQRPSSPGRALPYHGRWSAMRSESRKHTTEMKEIVTVLEKEGLGPDQCSSEEVVRVLFTRQKELGEKLKEAEDVLTANKNGDPRPVIQELKNERKALKRTVDDLKQNVSTLESQLKLTEMTSKRQLEDLLAEKKSSFLQLQKAIDDCDAAKSAAEQAQKDLVDSKSMLSKRQNELQLLRDNLLNVTNEMKTVDADLGKTKKDLSIKSAELERMKRDIVLETEKIQQERKNNSRLSMDLETKKRVIKESEKVIAELESKVQRFSENLEASQMHINRVSSERDSAKEEVQSLRGSLITNEAELRQSNSVVGNLKNQIKSLEYALQEKVDRLAVLSNELEKAKADSLGASHLLGIEEDKNKELEDELDELTYKLSEKTEEVEKLQERIKMLEEDLDQARTSLSTIQLDYAETETSLKSHESTRTMLAKELNSLQVEYREVTREKQRMQEIFDETKRSLQQKNDRLVAIDKELMEHKHQVKEKTRLIQEVERERDSLQEQLTYQKTQNELLTENIDTTKAENRKQIKEIEALQLQLKDLTERRGSLSDELQRITDEYRAKGEKDQTKLEALQHEKEVLLAEIKAAQALIRKQFGSFNMYDATDGPTENGTNIKDSVNNILRRLARAEQDYQTSKEEATQYESETQRLKSEMEQMSKLMSNEKLSLTNELKKMKDDVYQELEIEKQKHDDEIKQMKRKHDQQKDEIQKLGNNLMEAENKTSQMEQLINEKESQLRMITKEKEQLMDSVEFLQKEIKNADTNLMEKEKELQSIKSEKELKVSELTLKQEQILHDLKEANEKLADKETEQLMKSSQADEIVNSLKKENEEMKLVKSQIEEEVLQLEKQLKAKEDEKKAITKKHKEEIKSLDDQVSNLEEKLIEQENALEKAKRDLEKKKRENSNLNSKVKELIEETERVGDQNCQVAQVQQVESAGMGFDMFEFEEKKNVLEKEKEEIKKKLDETTRELEKQKKVSYTKQQGHQDAEREKQNLKQELEYEKREKIEALNCLKALIVDNEAMAKCVNGLQETVALQRQENTDTRRHLKEVLDKYELQREVSLRTQKTFEDLMDSKLSHDQLENRRLKENCEQMKKEKERIALQMEHKESELQRVTAEVDDLKGLVETKIINFEVEKRARELLESKFQRYTADSSFAQKRLYSMEDSQKDLHSKLMDLQKWHNSLEVSLLHGSSKSPLSIKDLYEDQKRREKFLNDQVAALSEKYEKLEQDKRFPVDKNIYSEE